jgi:pilus assembly protein CpaE
VRERISPLLVSRVLKALRNSFDYIVVDTAPDFDEQTLTALDETDECVIVATLDVPTLKNVKVAMETLEMLDIARGHRHLLLNRADDQVGLSPDRVESILGMEIATRLESSPDIASATNAGRPIVSEQPGHSSSLALSELATRLTGEPLAPDSASSHPSIHPPQTDRKAGLFRRKG